MSTHERAGTRPSIEGPQHERPEGPSPLQQHFLDRLAFLIDKRAELLRQAPRDKAQEKLLSRTIYAILMDCVGAGVGDHANAMIDASKVQAGGDQPAPQPRS